MLINAGINQRFLLDSKSWCIAVFFSAMFPLLVPLSWAESPAALPSALSVQSDLIGVAAAVRGSVELAREGVVGKKIESGENIYLGDKITTDDKGRMQILLLDETVFTIGPNSALVIDKFIYDPQTHDGEIKAKIVKGTFRFVTGKIGHKKPSQMTVDLPAGSIGIRGTIVAGQTEGTHSFVMLMGPGEGNNTGNTAGAMTLSNDVNGTMQVVEINRAGYGSVIEGDGAPPLPPFQVPQDQINSLMGSLSPTPGTSQGASGGGGGSNSGNDSTGSDIGSASDAAGANTFGAAISADGINANIENVDQIDTVTSPAAQNTVNNSNNTPSSTATSGYYASTGNQLSLSSGSYNFRLEINSTSFGGSNSYVEGAARINTQDTNFKYAIPQTLFTDMNVSSVEMAFSAEYSNRIPNTYPSAPSQDADIILTFSSDPTRGVPITVTHNVTVFDPVSGYISVNGSGTDTVVAETT